MNMIGTPTSPPAPRALLFDISRLLAQAHKAAPTGIDRVELAYAEYLLAHERARTLFVACHPLGRFGTLPQSLVSRFVGLLAAHWEDHTSRTKAEIRAIRRYIRLRLLLGVAPAVRAPIYLLLSHHHLTRPSAIARFLARSGASFVPMVHDFIPSDYPEYARPKHADKHLRRIATVARLADSVLVPSEVIRQGVVAHLRQAGRGHIPVHAVPHGVMMPAKSDPPPISEPYFVCLGTIEPRKNHLLLLNIWRRLVETHGKAAPKLILIGRRGWENENAIDMIERSPALQSVVKEYNTLPDRGVFAFLKGARALLLPSFAEGFGLPVAEALALGVPVICSDIPIFREIGLGLPEYLDPLDGLGWLRAVERHMAAPPAPRTVPDWMDWFTSIQCALRQLEHGLGQLEISPALTCEGLRKDATSESGWADQAVQISEVRGEHRHIS
jgi:glycosyltransferase involved in cell wall biosynthesis